MGGAEGLKRPINAENEKKILVELAMARGTVRVGQVPCMGRRVNPARTGR